VSYGDSAATAKLAANDGALISPETAEMIVELHADDDLIRDAALSRHDMPPSVITKLIDHSADKIEVNLKTYPGISDHRAAQVSRDTRERAQTYVVGEAWPDDRSENRAPNASKFQLLVAERLVSLELDFPKEIESDLIFSASPCSSSNNMFSVVDLSSSISTDTKF